MDSQPLFGETRRKVKVMDFAFATLIICVVLATIILALISSVLLPNADKCRRLGQPDKTFCVSGVDIVMVIVILLELIPVIVLTFWYRRGELEPKFRTLIYVSASLIILLCCVANCYFFQLGLSGVPATPSSAPTTPTSSSPG